MTFNSKKLPAPKSNKPQQDPLETGSYPARLVQLIILGVQKQRPYKGEEKPPKLEARLTYEILDEFLKDDKGEDQEDKPLWINERLAFMSMSQDLAKSTKRYYAIDPDDTADGDWAKLLGKACIVNVVQSKGSDDRIYANVGSVSTMRAKEAAKAPELKNPALAWDFYNPDMEVFASFPDWLKGIITDAVDYEGSALAKALGGGKVTKPKEVEEDEEAETEGDW